MALIKHLVFDVEDGEPYMAVAKEGVDLATNPGPADKQLDTRLGRGAHIVMDSEEMLPSGAPGTRNTVTIPVDYPVSNVMWGFRETGGDWSDTVIRDALGGGNLGASVFGPWDGKEIVSGFYVRRLLLDEGAIQNGDTRRIGPSHVMAQDPPDTDGMINDASGNLSWRKSTLHNSMGPDADIRVIGFNEYRRPGVDAQVLASRATYDSREVVGGGTTPPAIYRFDDISLGLEDETRCIVVDLWARSGATFPATAARLNVHDPEGGADTVIEMTEINNDGAELRRFAAEVPAGFLAQVEANKNRPAFEAVEGLCLNAYRLKGVDGAIPYASNSGRASGQTISRAVEFPDASLVIASGARFRSGSSVSLPVGIGRFRDADASYSVTINNGGVPGLRQVEVLSSPGPSVNLTTIVVDSWAPAS